MSEWDGIEGLAAWQSKLKSLLDTAKQAATADVPVRQAIAERLIQFIEHSFPNDEATRALDDIASAAAGDILKATIDQRIAEIIGRSAQLAALQKQFENLAMKGNAEAASIRLEKVREVADQLTAAVTTLRNFKTTLTKGSEQELAAALERGIKTVQDLRKLVEEKGSPTRA